MTEAVADPATEEPESVAPAAGALRETVGAVVSGAGGGGVVVSFGFGDPEDVFGFVYVRM